VVLDGFNSAERKDGHPVLPAVMREGVCGSDGMNMTAKMALACITRCLRWSKKDKLGICAVGLVLPGHSVIWSWILSMFFKQV